METNGSTNDDLRPEYDLSQLDGGVRGKYFERYGNGSFKFLAAAIACGAIPLTLGTLIYWTWRTTRWEWLPGAGLYTILAGLVLFAAGVICLAVYMVREGRVERTRRVPLGLQGLIVGGLLVVNFPAAAFYANSAIDLMVQCRIHIINESGKAVNSFLLTGPGVDTEAGPIPQAGRTQCYLDFHGDGPLNFSAKQQDFQFQGQLAEYVTGGWGGEITVKLKPEGKYEVQDFFLRD